MGNGLLMAGILDGLSKSNAQIKTIYTTTNGSASVSCNTWTSGWLWFVMTLGQKAVDGQIHPITPLGTSVEYGAVIYNGGYDAYGEHFTLTSTLLKADDNVRHFVIFYLY